MIGHNVILADTYTHHLVLFKFFNFFQHSIFLLSCIIDKERIVRSYLPTQQSASKNYLYLKLPKNNSRNRISAIECKSKHERGNVQEKVGVKEHEVTNVTNE